MEAFGTSPAQHRLVTQKRLASSLVQSFLGSQLRHNAASEQRTFRCKFQVLATSHLFQHAWILTNLALHLRIQTRFWPMNAMKISQELNLREEFMTVVGLKATAAPVLILFSSLGSAECKLHTSWNCSTRWTCYQTKGTPRHVCPCRSLDLTILTFESFSGCSMHSYFEIAWSESPSPFLQPSSCP